MNTQYIYFLPAALYVLMILIVLFHMILVATTDKPGKKIYQREAGKYLLNYGFLTGLFIGGFFFFSMMDEKFNFLVGLFLSTFFFFILPVMELLNYWRRTKNLSCLSKPSFLQRNLTDVLGYPEYLYKKIIPAYASLINKKKNRYSALIGEGTLKLTIAEYLATMEVMPDQLPALGTKITDFLTSNDETLRANLLMAIMRIKRTDQNRQYGFFNKDEPNALHNYIKSLNPQTVNDITYLLDMIREFFVPFEIIQQCLRKGFIVSFDENHVHDNGIELVGPRDYYSIKEIHDLQNDLGELFSVDKLAEYAQFPLETLNFLIREEAEGNPCAKEKAAQTYSSFSQDHLHELIKNRVPPLNANDFFEDVTDLNFPMKKVLYLMENQCVMLYKGLRKLGVLPLDAYLYCSEDVNIDLLKKVLEKKTILTAEQIIAFLKHDPTEEQIQNLTLLSNA